MDDSRRDDWLSATVGPTHRLAALVAGAAVLAVAALVGVAWAAGFGSVRHLLLHPRWDWLALAWLGEVVAYAGYTVAYREVASAEPGAELEVPHAAALVATGFGVFLQGGGFALDREALRRAGLPAHEARARVLGLGALEYAVLAPAAAIAAAIVLLRGLPISGSLTLPWIVGVPAGAALTFALLPFERRLTRGRRLGKHVARGLYAVRLVLRLAGSPRKHGLAFGGIALYWIGDVFCLWAALHAFSAQTPPVAQLVVGYATGYAITRRALPLGGAGIVEALLPFALGWVGLALAPALLAVFAYRVINLWLPMIPAIAGLPALARLERRSRRPWPRRV